jgi:hypothetical protein
MKKAETFWKKPWGHDAQEVDGLCGVHEADRPYLGEADRLA